MSHGIISIVTVVNPSTKLSPFMVIRSPPDTLPYLGTIESIYGVFVEV